MFYTEAKGHRWAMMAANHKTLKSALRDAIRTSNDCSEVRVWDCRSSPVGTLVAVYCKGKRRK